MTQRSPPLAKKSGKVSVVSVTGDEPLIKLRERITVSPAELPLALAGIVKAVAQLKSATPPAGLESVEPSAASTAIAESLLSGEKHAIFLGNAAEQSTQAAQLHALASELARLTGDSFGFIGEAANSEMCIRASQWPEGVYPLGACRQCPEGRYGVSVDQSPARLPDL